ncbi:MAG: c-type cytochrome [Verrucomicrobia bacterium]|nr:c-type cytochrome [Verrucomicrobiota bacterium]
MSFLRCLLTACTLSASLHAAEDKMRLVRETAALTPEQERAGLHVPPGFTVQLFASEPMINKPINMAFDARGRLWVSSTVEYPYAADKSRWSDEKGTRVKDSRDAIKILADTDGDGKADKVTDFADGLNIPTGVLPWHKPEHKAGCIAWSIPNIWYFADTDGDDKADHREILFGPLGYEKDTHGMCSSFRLGLDGWVYATHGFNNTSHLKAKDGSTLDLHSGNVFRFRPDGSRVEKWTSGQVNPFGLCWDRFGNLYSADCHSSPIYQLIRGACYPSFGKPDDGLGFAPVMCEHSHGSTGICGIVYLDGGVWGPEWDDHTLVGNCVTSRVNHDKVTFTGSTPKANEQPDFITSDDPWFRPVDLQLGPDNALYIADFYNKIIGHYEVPLDHPGRDKERGRIWRVVNLEHTVRPTEWAEYASSAQKMRLMLEKGSPAQRKTATEWFVQSPELWNPENYAMCGNCAEFELRKMDQRAVVANTWVRFRLGNEQDRQSISRGVSEMLEEQNFAWKHASVRLLTAFDSWSDQARAAMLLTVRELPTVQSPTLRVLAQALAAHPSPEFIAPLMMHLARVPQDDTALRLAIKIALRSCLEVPHGCRELEGIQISASQNADLLQIVSSTPSPEASQYLWDHYSSSKDTHLQQTALLHAARYGEPKLIEQAIAFARESSVQSDSNSAIQRITAIHNGLSERGAPANPELLQWAQELATQLLDSADKQPVPTWTALGDAKWSLQTRKCADGSEAQVLQSMAKGGGDEEKRTGMLKSKSFAAPEKLVLWVDGHRGPPTAEAHDKNFVRVVDAQSGAALASVFPPRHNDCRREELDLAKYVGKSVRLEIVDGDDRKAYAWLGVTRIEPKVVSVNDFQNEDSARESLKTLATMLQHSAPAALREKLAAYLPPRPAPPPLPVSPEQRKKLDTLIAARVAAFAKAKPDLETGANVFKMNCTACHQIKGEGGLIGPQLDGIGARGPERLCEDILDPNRNVDAHFHLHTLTLKDSSTFAGFLKAELGQVNVLADATGKEHRIGKKDIAKTEVTPISLMPPTFGQTIEEATFIDLLGYLLNEKAGK